MGICLHSLKIIKIRVPVYCVYIFICMIQIVIIWAKGCCCSSSLKPVHKNMLRTICRLGFAFLDYLRIAACVLLLHFQGKRGTCMDNEGFKMLIWCCVRSFWDTCMKAHGLLGNNAAIHDRIVLGGAQQEVVLTTRTDLHAQRARCRHFFCM